MQTDTAFFIWQERLARLKCKRTICHIFKRSSLSDQGEHECQPQHTHAHQGEHEYQPQHTHIHQGEHECK